MMDAVMMIAAAPPFSYAVSVTVLEVIKRGAGFLGGKGVESPRQNIEEILAQVLGLPRLELYLNFDRALDKAELDAARKMIRRRASREPLQHVLGTACFCGLELEVNCHVLVPRPETELLAELAVKFLSARSGAGIGTPLVLDLGTGSGCLAIVLARDVPSAVVHAVDVSPEALAMANRNAARHDVIRRVHFHAGDGFHALPEDIRFDLIVSNPPYVPTAEIQNLPPEVRDHDPRLALDGGADGLMFFRRLAAEAAFRLEPSGRLMLEFGDGQAPAVRQILAAQNWVVEAIEEDYNHQPRLLVAHPSQDSRPGRAPADKRLPGAGVAN